MRMKNILFLLSFVLFTSPALSSWWQPSPCGRYQSESLCEGHTDCKWSGKSCLRKGFWGECEVLETSEACARATVCQWDQAAFRCYDLKEPCSSVRSEETCDSRPSCGWDEVSGCLKRSTLHCAQVHSRELCRKFDCHWAANLEGGSCLVKEDSFCSDMATNEDCEYRGCHWNVDTCIPDSDNSCRMISTFESCTKATYCFWLQEENAPSRCLARNDETMKKMDTASRCSHFGEDAYWTGKRCLRSGLDKLFFQNCCTLWESDDVCQQNAGCEWDSNRGECHLK